MKCCQTRVKSHVWIEAINNDCSFGHIYWCNRPIKSLNYSQLYLWPYFFSPFFLSFKKTSSNIRQLINNVTVTFVTQFWITGCKEKMPLWSVGLLMHVFGLRCFYYWYFYIIQKYNLLYSYASMMCDILWWYSFWGYILSSSNFLAHLDT